MLIVARINKKTSSEFPYSVVKVLSSECQNELPLGSDLA